MSYEREKLQWVEASASNMTSTADVATFTPSTEVEVYEFGVVITTDLTASDNLIIAADLRTVAGSDTGRGNGDVGTLTIAAGSSGGIDAGDVIMCRPSAPVAVSPGEEVVIEVTNAVAAGAGYCFVNYRALPAPDGSNVTVVTS